MKTVAVTITTSATDPCEPFYESCMGEPGLELDVYRNVPNEGAVAGLQAMYEKHRDKDIIAFFHSDVTVYEQGWARRVMEQFSFPSVGVVGFGGATGIGVRDIYKTPYEISQLQRVDYYSNQRGWEIHGSHEDGVRREVAVVDGFFMACRVEMLNQIGGWKWFPHRFHGYDTCLCLMARRMGWKVFMVGVDVDHHGGGTSTKAEYFENLRELGTTAEREHWEPHKWMYEEFRKELPLRV